MGTENKAVVENDARTVVVHRVIHTLKSNQEGAISNIYNKYQKESIKSIGSEDSSDSTDCAINDTPYLSLSFSIEYLNLHAKALYLDNPAVIESIDTFLQKIKVCLEDSKQKASTKKLEELNKLLVDFSKEIDSIPCQNKVVNVSIREAIKLAVISCEYIVNKMHRTLTTDEKYDTIEPFLKDDLRRHINSFIMEVKKLEQLNNFYFKELFLRANELKDKTRSNFFLEKEEIEEIKNKIKLPDKNKMEILKKKSYFYATQIDQLYLYLRYITEQMTVLYDQSNFEAYKSDYLSSYTLALPLTNRLIEDIKKLRLSLKKLSNDEIKKIEVQVHKVVFFSYDLLFTKPATSLESKDQLLGFLEELNRTLDEKLYLQTYSIKNKIIRNEISALIKNMAQTTGFAKEHLLCVYNVIKNSENKKIEYYLEDRYERLKQTILSTYVDITNEFPNRNYSNLESKIKKLFYLMPKDENEKKSIYLQTIIYLDTVLKILQTEQSEVVNTRTELPSFNPGLIRSKLFKEKMALMATNLKPVSNKKDQRKKQEVEPSVKSPSIPENTTEKNAIDFAQNTLLLKKRNKLTVKDQIQVTINSFNSLKKILENDFKILKKNIPSNYQNSLSLDKVNVNSHIIQKIKSIEDLLNNLSQSKSKPIQLKSIYLKLNFLKNQHTLYNKISIEGAKNTGDNLSLNANYLPFVLNDKFINNLMQLKALLIKPIKNLKVNSCLNQFLQLEKNVFNPLNISFSSDVFNLKLTKIRLQNIQTILDECLIHIPSLNEQDKKTEKNLLKNTVLATIISEIQIIDSLSTAIPPLPPKTKRVTSSKKLAIGDKENLEDSNLSKCPTNKWSTEKKALITVKCNRSNFFAPKSKQRKTEQNHSGNGTPPRKISITR